MWVDGFVVLLCFEFGLYLVVRFALICCLFAGCCVGGLGLICWFGLVVTIVVLLWIGLLVLVWYFWFSCLGWCFDFDCFDWWVWL